MIQVQVQVPYHPKIPLGVFIQHKLPSKMSEKKPGFDHFSQEVMTVIMFFIRNNHWMMLRSY